MLACVVLLMWVVTRIDDYRLRSDLVDQRAAALTTFKDADLLGLYQFIRNSTAPSDVFLSADNVGLSVVAVAGRKVVALDRFFSNPFVDWARRSRDRDQMQTLLADGDGPGFMALATRYHVRYSHHNRPLTRRIRPDRLLCDQALAISRLVRLPRQRRPGHAFVTKLNRS